MNEHRTLSAEEWAEFKPVFEKAGYHNRNEAVRAFLDAYYAEMSQITMIVQTRPCTL